MRRLTNLRHMIGHMKLPNFLTFVSDSALVLFFGQTVRLNFRIDLNVKLKDSSQWERHQISIVTLRQAKHLQTLEMEKNFFLKNSIRRFVIRKIKEVLCKRVH